MLVPSTFRAVVLPLFTFTFATWAALASAPLWAQKPAAASEPERRITLSRRAAGPAERPAAARVVVDLDALPAQTRTGLDAAGTTLTVQGVSLQALIDQAPRDAGVDGARLRFKNGTEVLVPLAQVAALDLFVARRLKHSEQAPFTTDFDSVPLGPASWQAPRSLVFTGNRVFVAKPTEPVPGGVSGPSKPFVPWAFLDSLVEVELLHLASWQRVFEVSAATRAGHDVWRARCQTCHGVRGAGANFGWDFVVPLPLSTLRSPESLFTHVKAHKLEAAQLGLAMPAQPDVTRAEIDALHAWMTALSQRPLPPYAPPEAPSAAPR